jgi:hypothetical protein
MKRPLLAAVAALMLGGATLAAHHSFAAEFDINKPVTLQGTVTKVEWVNPHVYVYLDVKDASGKVTPWSLSSFSPVESNRTLSGPFRPSRNRSVAIERTDARVSSLVSGRPRASGQPAPGQIARSSLSTRTSSAAASAGVPPMSRVFLAFSGT